MEDHELTQVSPAAKVPSRAQMGEISQREYEDRVQLMRLGKKSVLKRNFSFLTILGFSCAVLVTWEGTLMSFAPGLINGGPAGLVYGFLFVWAGNLTVFSTLCELVSMAPTSGGQYHWVSMLAPRRCARFLSYITGWLTVAGWQGTAASGAYLAGSMLQGVVAFTMPQYTGQTWQGTLIVWAVVLVAVFINTVVSSALPKIEGMILVLHIVGFFGVLITLLTFGAHGDASEVFANFRNGGWPTQGLSFFVGLLGLIFSFAGVDCSFHMCEEVQNPSVAVPRSIMGSLLINGLMGLAMVISMLFAATDIDAAINSKSGYPFIEIFFQATGSKAGTAVMASLIIFMTISAVVGVIATTSRMFWAFARDRALPAWRTLSKVDPTTHVPIWAIGVTSLISCLLALINIGSTVVYNALVSLSICGLYSSYLIASCTLLYRRTTGGFAMPDASSPLPALAEGDNAEGLIWGPWHVPGVLGIVNNSLACAYLLTMLFFSFWPPAPVSDAKDMNFSVLMTGAVVIFSIVYYLVWAKRDYKGPIREV
ncbi:amino acid/polyamine transporter I [Cordyceps fumosorosea ARSEF 2679]|uniref:Amino acid/polyamine transporter I n=1 Tax=Cordyceps fumosorosea (strain ARSEF 2679) TaxID=1081104 RepID=A0A167MS54_CORFA|nr:amino acid/polyamine transporter I [Cordyceps fumosorosea ARSEF 2679]OAA54694.1 amino acid/polyamine transporter I [Cordyceps fumosorosea ARSEF 2679]